MPRPRPVAAARAPHEPPGRQRQHTPESEDRDFDDADASTTAANVAAYEAELVIVRVITTAWTDLSALVRKVRRPA